MRFATGRVRLFTSVKSLSQPLSGPLLRFRLPRAESEAIPPGELDETAVAPVSRAKFVALGLSALVLLGASIAYAVSWGKQSTDDAQVEGHVANVSSRVAGIVQRVYVKDNQTVRRGELLVELDRAEIEARADAANADVQAAEAALESARAAEAVVQANVAATLEQAHAGVTQAHSGLAASRARSAQARAETAAAQARQRLAQAEFARTNQLVAAHARTPAQYDVAHTALLEANAALVRAKARIAAESAQISADFGGIQSAHGRLIAAESAPQQIASAHAAVAVAAARLQQARASERSATLNLSYTTIRAPSDGVIAHRSVELGQLVSPERPLFAIVPLDDLWVVANFKEDQLHGIQPGARSEVIVDAYDHHPLTGVVESISAGTGARFALLPPDNASGNFTKVVQRVPVLVRLSLPKDLTLRPGLSAKVTVYSGAR